jgi:hypothetical protein
LRARVLTRYRSVPAKDVDAEVARGGAFPMKDIDAAPTTEVALGPARVPLIERQQVFTFEPAGAGKHR